jgi:hypothetical protein
MTDEFSLRRLDNRTHKFGGFRMAGDAGADGDGLAFEKFVKP